MNPSTRKKNLTTQGTLWSNCLKLLIRKILKHLENKGILYTENKDKDGNRFIIKNNASQKTVKVLKSKTKLSATNSKQKYLSKTKVKKTFRHIKTERIITSSSTLQVLRQKENDTRSLDRNIGFYS